MSGFFKRQFNKKIFFGVLFVVLVFGGEGYKYNIAYADFRSVGGTAGLYGIEANWPKGEVRDKSAGIKYTKNGIEADPNPDPDDNNSFSVWLLNTAADFLAWTTSAELYENVFFSDIARGGITQSWEIVRGFINMFYLLILVFLAITTILRINKFNDKKLFFNVIVSAILVNFSMAITLVVIDFSNLIMTYFASAIKDVNAVATFFANSHYTDAIVKNSQTINGHSFILEKSSEMIGFIVNIIMAVMVFFTGISLLIRLVAYWVLIILSPLAFFSIALPGSNGFKEWSDKLMWYSFYGPIMLFFIWLSLFLSNYLNQAFTQAPNTSISDNFVTFLTSYITVLYLLYYGHDKAKSMAKKAGDTVGMLMDKGGQYAVKAGKGAAMLTPIGWGAAAGMGAKSYAGSHLTGMKARINEGKWTRLLTEEGRKESKEEMDHKGKMFWASPSKKDRLEMEAIERTKSKLKDKVDLKNRDQVLNLLNKGSVPEKKMAAQIAAQEGWLDGKNLKTALEVADGNKLLTQSIKTGAGAKNKVSLANYNLSKYDTSATNSDEEKAVHGNIKSLMSTKAVKAGDEELIRELDAKDNLTKDEARSFVDNNFGGDRRKAMHYGMFEGANSMNKIADLLNEKMSRQDMNELTKNFAEYINDDRFGGQRFSDGGNLNKLRSMVNPVVNINLTKAGVDNGNTTIARGEGSNIYTGPDRPSSRRENPQGGNFNGPDLGV